MFRSLVAKRKQFVPDNPFFFETGRASGVLGKQGICLHFSELYYNPVYTKK